MGPTVIIWEKGSVFVKRITGIIITNKIIITIPIIKKEFELFGFEDKVYYFPENFIVKNHFKFHAYQNRLSFKLQSEGLR